MNAPLTPASVIEQVREAVRLRKLQAHDDLRDQERDEAIDNGYFDREPYSIHVVPTEYRAPCGCVGRYEEECDGKSVWPEWRWCDDACSVLGQGERA